MINLGVSFGESWLRLLGKKKCGVWHPQHLSSACSMNVVEDGMVC